MSAHTGKRVIVNTGILYGRMLLTIGVSLYATRLVLNALGSIDYGIFNLVAGIIALLSFLNTAMTTSTQRYLSFYQGNNDEALLKKIFANSLFLHLLIGILVVIVLEGVGVFLFNGFLNIPVERIASAKVIYHYMSFTVFFSIAVVPYMASLNAHENMLWIAIIYIIEVFCKLAIALLLFVVAEDKLILFAMLTGVTSVLFFVAHMTYCIKKYKECSIRSFGLVDKKIIRELSSFAGWNLFGTLCFLGRTQGLAVLLNLFFGAMINAAYAIANQIAAQMGFFSVAMLQALNPQIMKSEGQGDRNRMLSLSMTASKFGFLLFAFIAVPCIFEMSAILKFWLNDVPDYTVIFCQLTLLGALINQLTIGVQSAIQATGRIKVFQMIVGSIILLNVPVAYLLLQFGFPAFSVLVGYICIELVACTARLVILKNISGLSIKEYLVKAIQKNFLPVLLCIISCYLIVNYVDFSHRFIFTTVTSIIVLMLSVYYFGLESEEKQMVDSVIKKMLGKVLSKVSYS